MSFGEITVSCGMNRSISLRKWNRMLLEHNSVQLRGHGLLAGLRSVRYQLFECLRVDGEIGSRLASRERLRQAADSHSGESVMTGSSPFSLSSFS